MTFAELEKLVSLRSLDDRKRLFESLRKQFPIHDLEKEFNAFAEVILEAIARSPDITKRGIRGLLAEAAFIRDVIPKVESEGWKDVTPPLAAGDNAPTFDAILGRDGIKVRIQVKTQRRDAGQPWVKRFPQPWGECYVVETQRTRGGKDKKTGLATRPYQYGQFDVLATCMWASTGDWNNFRYALGKDLLPKDDGSDFIATLQPIPIRPTAKDIWLTSFSDILQAFVARRNEP